MKPRIFLGFLEENIILCILKGEMPFEGKMPFKMHKIISFSRKKSVCVPYLYFSDPLHEALHYNN